jgi:hypothetical protein
MRKPGDILGHPDVKALIDFSRPVAVLFIAVLGIRRRRLLVWLPQTARPQVTGPRGTGATYASRMLPASRTARQARCRYGGDVRISDDEWVKDEKTGELRLSEKGITRQKEDIAAKAGQLGVEISEWYPENDTTAFKKRRIRLPNGRSMWRVYRPEFRRMLADYDRQQGLTWRTLTSRRRKAYPLRKIAGHRHDNAPSGCTPRTRLVAGSRGMGANEARRSKRCQSSDGC